MAILPIPLPSVFRRTSLSLPGRLNDPRNYIRTARIIPEAPDIRFSRRTFETSHADVSGNRRALLGEFRMRERRETEKKWFHCGVVLTRGGQHYCFIVVSFVPNNNNNGVDDDDDDVVQR